MPARRPIAGRMPMPRDRWHCKTQMERWMHRRTIRLPGGGSSRGRTNGMYHCKGRKFHCCARFFGFVGGSFNLRSSRRNGALTSRACLSPGRALRVAAARRRSNEPMRSIPRSGLQRSRPRYCDSSYELARLEYVGSDSAARYACCHRFTETLAHVRMQWTVIGMTTADIDQCAWKQPVRRRCQNAPQHRRRQTPQYPAEWRQMSRARQRYRYAKSHRISRNARRTRLTTE